MTTPVSLLPQRLRAELIHELDVLLGTLAHKLCNIDVESGVIPECTLREELLRRLAVAAGAADVIGMIVDSLFMRAAEDPDISQPAIGRVLGLTQQGVAYRISKLRDHTKI